MLQHDAVGRCKFNQGPVKHLQSNKTLLDKWPRPRHVVPPAMAKPNADYAGLLARLQIELNWTDFRDVIAVFKK